MPLNPKWKEHVREISAWIREPKDLSGVLERSASIIPALISEMDDNQIDRAFGAAKLISKR